MHIYIYICHESLKCYNPFGGLGVHVFAFSVCVYTVCYFDDSSTGPSPWHTLRRHLHNPSSPPTPSRDTFVYTHNIYINMYTYTCVCARVRYKETRYIGTPHGPVSPAAKTNGRWLVRSCRRMTSVRALGQTAGTRTDAVRFSGLLNVFLFRFIHLFVYSFSRIPRSGCSIAYIGICAYIYIHTRMWNDVDKRQTRCVSSPQPSDVLKFFSNARRPNLTTSPRRRLSFCRCTIFSAKQTVDTSFSPIIWRAYARKREYEYVFRVPVTATIINYYWIVFERPSGPRCTLRDRNNTYICSV